MHLDMFLQWKAFALSSLVLTVDAAVYKAPLQFESSELATLPSDKWSSRFSERADASAKGYPIGLQTWFNRTDLQWSTRIGIGSPAMQYVTVAITTTNTPLLVPNTNCTSCVTPYKYTPLNSTTSKVIMGNPSRWEFTTGPDTVPLRNPEGAECRIINDTLGIGDLKVDTQAFLTCDQYDNIFNKMPIGGILGLDTYDQTIASRSYFGNLWENKKLDSPVFTFYLPSGSLLNGQLTLGGVDTTKYTGEIRTVRLHVDTNGLTWGRAWMVGMSGLYANSKLLANSTDGKTPMSLSYAVFDTGTAFIQTPDVHTATALYAQISPKFEMIDPAGAWGVPCETMATLAPTLTFTFGEGTENVNFTIPAKNYNLGEYPTKKGYCQGVFNSPITPSMAPDNKPTWIIGSPFLKEFYSVWNGLEKHIGFARPSVIEYYRPEPSWGPLAS